MTTRRVLTTSLLIIAVLLLSACGNRVLVEIPPKAPVEGIRHIVIMPFENVSGDASLAYEIEERIAKALQESRWYDSVTTLRQTVSFPAGQPITFETVRHIEQVAKADAVLLGTATYYFEDVFMGVPQCSGCDRPDRVPSWSVRQSTTVSVRFTGRLIEVATGRELYVASATGDDTDIYTVVISHRTADPPPESLIPKPNRQRVPITRDWAIDRAVRQFTRDLLPTHEWRSVD